MTSRSLCCSRWQAANLLTLIVSILVAWSVPRLDSSDVSWRSMNYFAPAQHASLVWRVIYGLDCLFVIWHLLQPKGRVPPARADLLHRASPWWCIAHLCQALWRLTFRAGLDGPGLLWISAVALSGLALCLDRAHRAVMAASDMQELLFLYVPITLRFGWASAAALVSWNGYVARCSAVPGLKLVVLLASLGLAAALSTRVTLLRRSALYGATMAWALLNTSLNTWQSPSLEEDFGTRFSVPLGNLEFGLSAAALAVSIGVTAGFRQVKAIEQEVHRGGSFLWVPDIPSKDEVLPRHGLLSSPLGSRQRW